ncbi:hypothetical protein ACFYYH_09450 [Streptomyces sp. NPDC002018]|uniref:hypothetical protein n=1 Tax=Streptomyces sp. NPDC002018 TaxID=3364629 RepID=UPI0036AFFA94
MTGPGRPGGTARAAGAPALAGLAALIVLATGCSAGGTGTRDEGAAVTMPVERAIPAPRTSRPAPARTVDAVSLLRRDPKVGRRIKADLKPCAEDTYPVDTSYGDLTGGAAPDVVINVMTCADAIGIGTYVYRSEDGRYRNVFASEEPAVYATIDRGALVVTRQVYAKGDPVSYPSGEDVVTYHWGDARFSERYRVRNDYSRAVGNGGVSTPVPTVPTGN